MVNTPDQSIIKANDIRIFLAGTIDNGNSVDWQSDAIQELHELFGEQNVMIYNPRNENWNPSLKQSMEVPEFANQVQWEYDAMCAADEIIMNFLPNSKSPITLLELGLFADSDKLHVINPKEFYRHGNIDFVCESYGIPQYSSITAIAETLKNRYKC